MKKIVLLAMLFSCSLFAQKFDVISSTILNKSIQVVLPYTSHVRTIPFYQIEYIQTDKKGYFFRSDKSTFYYIDKKSYLDLINIINL